MNIENLEPRRLFSATGFSAKIDPLSHLYAKEYIAQPLATFNHPAGMNTTSVTALISWGDGATEGYSTLQNLTAVSDTQMSVTCGQGLHTYAKAGVYNLKVTFSQNNKILATARKAVSVTQNSTGGRSVQLTTGNAKPIDLGTFTSTTTPASSLVVSWGDGVLGAAVVTALKNHQYRVMGSHAYARAGSYRVRVLNDLSNLVNAPTIPLISDLLGSTAVVRGPGKSVPTPTVTLNGAPSPILYHSKAILATVTGIAPGGYTRTPTANIQFGDITVTGEVQVVNNQYVVVGELPLFTTEQHEQVTVTLYTGDHADPSKETPLATLTQPLTIEPTSLGAIPVTAVAGTAFTGVLGNISGTSSRVPVAMKVSWGDSAGSINLADVEQTPIYGDPITITPTSDGKYQLSGSHTYASSGRYNIYGVINYSDGSADKFFDVAIIVNSAAELPVGTVS